jgi:hypothetical protein
MLVIMVGSQVKKLDRKKGFKNGSYQKIMGPISTSHSTCFSWNLLSSGKSELFLFPAK